MIDWHRWLPHRETRLAYTTENHIVKGGLFCRFTVFQILGGKNWSICFMRVQDMETKQ